jgi:hypothetical protein
MSQRNNLFAAAAVALVMVCIQVGEAQTSQNTVADETAIRQVVKLVEDGWNAHDGKAFAASSPPMQITL